MSWLFILGGQIIGASALASVLPVNIQDFSRESSPAPQFESISFWHSVFFMVQLSHPFLTMKITIALTIWTFVGKVLSLLFNTLPRFVIFSSKDQSSFNFMAAVTIHSDFGAQQKNSVTASTFHFHALEKEMTTTPVFLPGESQGWGSLVGCHLWAHTELDTTGVT